MSVQTVARRYASALADITISRAESNDVKKDLDYWSSLIKSNPLLDEVFANPTIPFDQKRRVLEDLISRTRTRETTSSFLRVLLKNQRMAQISDIAERYGQILDDRAGIVAADVTTARPVPDQVQAALQQTLVAATGRKVRLSFVTDEKIIGGMIARIGSTVFDGSIQSQLERLAAELAGNEL